MVSRQNWGGKEETLIPHQNINMTTFPGPLLCLIGSFFLREVIPFNKLKLLLSSEREKCSHLSGGRAQVEGNASDPLKDPHTGQVLTISSRCT